MGAACSCILGNNSIKQRPVCQRSPHASIPLPSLPRQSTSRRCPTASPAPIFSLPLFSAPESGHSTPALRHFFPLSAHLAADAARNPCLMQIRQPFIANWRTNSAVMMLARQSILALCRERCCFKKAENPLAFGMVYVVAKLALCHVFQRVLFFCRV